MRRESSAIVAGDVSNIRGLVRALNRDMSVSRTSGHKEVILGRNSVFRVFRLYLRSSDPRFNAQSKHSC